MDFETTASASRYVKNTTTLILKLPSSHRLALCLMPTGYLYLRDVEFLSAFIHMIMQGIL